MKDNWWGFSAPITKSCARELIKEFGTECPMHDDEQFADFARWFAKDNPCLFTVMVCAYSKEEKHLLRCVGEVEDEQMQEMRDVL